MRHARGGALWFKLTAIFLGMAVAVLVSVFFVLSRWDSTHAEISRAAVANAAQYADFLIKDLNSASALREKSQKLGIGIRVEGPSGIQSSEEALPTLETLVVEGHVLGRMSDGSFYGWWKRRGFFVRKAGASSFAFFLPAPPHGAFGRRIAGILAGLLLVMAMGFIATRTALRPMDTLLYGARRLGDGELGFRLKRHGSREFRRIADGFNEMAERLQSMLLSRERLLQDVSHELRSPLARIRMAAELSSDAKLKQRIGEEVAEMDALVGEVLEMGRADVAGMRSERVEVAALVERVCQQRGRDSSVGERLQVSVHTSGVVIGKSQALGRAVGNLVDNALKYSSGVVSVTVTDQAGEVRIAVRDQGIGIATEHQGRIFEPFFRVDDSRSRQTGGFGLGLALAQRTVQAHGGHIQLQSSPGQGSTFTIVLKTV